MAENGASDQILLNDDALEVGTWMLVAGTIIYMIASSMLDFLAFGGKDPISYTDTFGGRGVMSYLWFGLMMGGAVGYKNASDKNGKRAVWQYRAAVWLGTLHALIGGFNLAMWWTNTEFAVRFYLQTLFQQQIGLKLQSEHLDAVLDAADFGPIADQISFNWLSGSIMSLGLAMLAVGVLVIYQYKKDALCPQMSNTE